MNFLLTVSFFIKYEPTPQIIIATTKTTINKLRPPLLDMKESDTNNGPIVRSNHSDTSIVSLNLLDAFSFRKIRIKPNVDKMTATINDSTSFTTKHNEL